MLVNSGNLPICDGLEAMIPLGDIIDRLSILQLSSEYNGDRESNEYLQIYAILFHTDVRLERDRKQHYLNRLKDINRTMWTLESKIRNTNHQSLEDIGKTAISLRDLNKVRISIRHAVDVEVKRNRLQPE